MTTKLTERFFQPRVVKRRDVGLSRLSDMRMSEFCVVWFVGQCRRRLRFAMSKTSSCLSVYIDVYAALTACGDSVCKLASHLFNLLLEIENLGRS